MKKTILLSGLILFILNGCGSKEAEKWTAYVYPDKQNSKRSVQVGEFSTLKACQEASKTKMIELDVVTRGSYKCGLNCSYHEGMKTQICKKMVQ
jgi:hypothetical protein